MIARAEMLEAIRVAEEMERRKSGRKLFSMFPETGPHRRELYVKHLELFRLGATKRERLFLAANRVGKTEAGAYEVACHLTGIYPSWWEGKRFNRPNHWWATGETRELVRKSLQLKLLGPMNDKGTGLIPRDRIEKVTPGFIPDSVQAIWVKHASGGVSTVEFKSYDQGREAFQAAELDGLWFDEEPPAPVYTEGLVRTMTTEGLVILTFTPLRGMSEVVLSFLPGGAVPENQSEGPRAVVTATWDDAPHLTAKMKADLWASIPPFQRDARSKGLPQLGAGAIYPVPESAIICDPFEIPKHWPRSFGLDVGWNKTAAIWGADDPETGVEYWYSEHYMGEAEPAVHASAIKARGPLPGCIDPASRGRSQVDGKQLIELYRAQGLDLSPADNAVEAGIFNLYERFSTGKTKIFSTLQHTRSELRLYRRDERGKVVKENDHLMDAGRYRSKTSHIARAPIPAKKPRDPLAPVFGGAGGGGWMG